MLNLVYNKTAVWFRLTGLYLFLIFDTTKERGVTLVGDYRARAYGYMDGSNRPQSPFRDNSANRVPAKAKYVRC